jgi:hypothetical protein
MKERGGIQIVPGEDDRRWLARLRKKNKYRKQYKANGQPLV